MAIEINSRPKQCWTTYSEDGSIEPWEVRVHRDTKRESHPVLVLAGVVVDGVMTHGPFKYITEGTVQVPLFETKEEADAAYPSLRLDEILKDMEKVKKGIHDLSVWVANKQKE